MFVKAMSRPQAPQRFQWYLEDPLYDLRIRARWSPFNEWRCIGLRERRVEERMVLQAELIRFLLDSEVKLEARMTFLGIFLYNYELGRLEGSLLSFLKKLSILVRSDWAKGDYFSQNWKLRESLFNSIFGEIDEKRS